MTRRSLGQELGEGSALFVQNIINRQDQVLAQQQQQEALRRQAEQQALDNAYRQQQAATQQAQFGQTFGLQQEQFGFNQQQWQDQRGDVAINQQRTASLDAAGQRENELRNGLAPSRNSFQQGIDTDLARYAPTLKDGRPNPQYDPAMFEATQGRQKQVQKLWSKVIATTGTGEGYDAAKREFLNFIGEGDDVALPQATAPMQGPPAPQVSVPAPMDISFPPAATNAPVQEPTQPAPVQAAPIPTAARVQDIPPSQLASFSDDDLQARYGRGGVEYARAARAEYAARLEAQQAAALKVRTEGWKIQLDELAKRTDLTGDQRLSMLTITNLLARPTLTDEEAQTLTAAFTSLTPKLYDSTSWQKVLDTKDPAIILAQLPVYQKFAPGVVQGFDASGLQTSLAADLDSQAATAAASRASALNSEANANATNEKLPGELAQQGATLASTQAGTAQTQAQTVQTQATTQKTRAETGQIGVEVDVAKQKAGLEGIDLLASLPADLSYAQVAQSNPGLVARIKNQLGLNDQGMLNLLRQAQYKYGLGLRGEELKNDLAGAQITNTESDTLSQNAQRGLTIAQTAGELADTTRTQSLLPGEVRQQGAQTTATLSQAGASDASAAASRAAANRSATLLPIDAAQGQANVLNTTARTGLTTAQTANAWANTGQVAEQIKNDRARTAAYVSSAKGQYAVNMATVQNLTATTALKRASNPNDPLYNPVVAASKPGDPIDKLKKQAGVYYTQADQALKQANSLQTQIDSLTKQGTGITGAFDKTRLPPAEQTKLNNLIKQRDNLMDIAINRRASGDKVVTDGMSGAGAATKGSVIDSIGTPGTDLIKAGFTRDAVFNPPNMSYCSRFVRQAIAKDMGVDPYGKQFNQYFGPTAGDTLARFRKNGALTATDMTPQAAMARVGELQRGDPVFLYYGNVKTDHLGVYDGNGGIIQNSSKGFQGQTIQGDVNRMGIEEYLTRAGSGATVSFGRFPGNTKQETGGNAGANTPPQPAAFKPNTGLEANLTRAFQTANRSQLDAVDAQMVKAGYSREQIDAVIAKARK
ncbi:hypothetical protein [Deinococcus sp. Leaf326]|uniref:hypothetical protein n=1 Tax=Deinococcus sp. Leaf326 TaxID=1736338 RepID=UPI00070177C3|nr:hypothetical protein [Deinococcus sp. Leaf326]KQR22860.1 hypothetical protein ASF71_06755 [Deinococcus sp. Leaf326]